VSSPAKSASSLVLAVVWRCKELDSSSSNFARRHLENEGAPHAATRPYSRPRAECRVTSGVLMTFCGCFIMGRGARSVLGDGAPGREVAAGRWVPSLSFPCRQCSASQRSGLILTPVWFYIVVARIGRRGKKAIATDADRRGHRYQLFAEKFPLIVRTPYTLMSRRRGVRAPWLVAGASCGFQVSDAPCIRRAPSSPTVPAKTLSGRVWDAAGFFSEQSVDNPAAMGWQQLDGWQCSSSSKPRRAVANHRCGEARLVARLERRAERRSSTRDRRAASYPRVNRRPLPFDVRQIKAISGGSSNQPLTSQTRTGAGFWTHPGKLDLFGRVRAAVAAGRPANARKASRPALAPGGAAVSVRCRWSRGIIICRDAEVFQQSHVGARSEA